VTRNHHGGRDGAPYVGLARGMRETATAEERKLWTSLRSRMVGGAKFRRQHQFGPYILDFYCAARHLAIELDGSQHFTHAGAAGDTARDAYLARRGVQVLRFTNLEVRSNFEGVIQAIEAALGTPSPGGRGQG